MDVLQFPLILHGYNPYLLYILPENVQVLCNYRIHLHHVHSADAFSMNPDVLHKWTLHFYLHHSFDDFSSIQNHSI